MKATGKRLLAAVGAQGGAFVVVLVLGGFAHVGTPNGTPPTPAPTVRNRCRCCRPAVTRARWPSPPPSRPGRPGRRAPAPSGGRQPRVPRARGRRARHRRARGPRARRRRRHSRRSALRRRKQSTRTARSRCSASSPGSSCSPRWRRIIRVGRGPEWCWREPGSRSSPAKSDRRRPGWTPRRGGLRPPDRCSCAPRPRRSWRATSSPRNCWTALRRMSWP